MRLQDLKPASVFANLNGVKSIIYGPAGSAKTPIINTAPRPLLLATEPGLLSMRGSVVPTYFADNADRMDEFFAWFFQSNEVKGFDTLAVDSVSHMCELYLQDEESGTSKSGNKKHGLNAYGEMANRALDQLDKLYRFPQKHMYLIAKQEIVSINGQSWRRPYYPGKKVPTEMPHKYDQILHLDIHNVPNMGQVLSFQCKQTIDTMARDRTGRLDYYEPPDFGLLVRKAMS